MSDTTRFKGYVYDLFERGNFIMRGTVKEIADAMGVATSTVGNWRSYDNKTRHLVKVAEILDEYEFYNNDGLVFKGTQEECSEYLCLTREAVRSIVNRSKTGVANGKKGGYRAVYVGNTLRYVNGKSGA